MMIPAVRSVLDRVETWPEERQEEAAALLERLDGSDDFVVPDEEVVEIERMMATGDYDTVSLEEFRTIFAAYLKWTSGSNVARSGNSTPS